MGVGNSFALTIYIFRYFKVILTRVLGDTWQLWISELLFDYLGFLLFQNLWLWFISSLLWQTKVYLYLMLFFIIIFRLLDRVSSVLNKGLSLHKIMVEQFEHITSAHVPTGIFSGTLRTLLNNHFLYIRGSSNRLASEQWLLSLDQILINLYWI